MASRRKSRTSTTRIRTSKGTTTIIRSKDKNVGTVSTFTPRGSSKSTITRGGGSNRSAAIAAVEKVGLSVAPSQVKVVEQKEPQLAAIRASPQTSSPQPTRRLRDDVPQFSQVPGTASSPFLGNQAVASSEKGGVITLREAKEIQRNQPSRRLKSTADSQFQNRLKLQLAGRGIAVKDQPVASSVSGGFVSAAQAEEATLIKESRVIIQRERDKIKAGSIGRFKAPDSEIIRVGNINKRFSVSERAKLERFKQTATFKTEKKERQRKVNIGAASVAGAGVAVVGSGIVAAGGTALLIGTGGAVATTAGIQKGAEAADTFKGLDTFKFKQDQPELAEAARLAGRAEAKAQTGVVGGFFNLDVSGDQQAFQIAGSRFLESKGVEGKELASAQLFLSRQSQIEATTEKSNLILAEAFGEAFGGGILFRLGKKGISKVGRRTAIGSTEALTEKSLKQSQFDNALVAAVPGGVAEGAFAATSISLLDEGKVNPTTTLIGAGLGGVTAGTFEFLRKGPSSGKTVRAGATIIGNVVEPQELLVDTTLSSFEKITRKKSKFRPELVGQFDDIPLRKDIISGKADDFSFAPRTKTPFRTRTVSLDISSNVIGAQSNTPISNVPAQSKPRTRIPSDTITESLTGSTTKQTTNTFTTDFSKSFAPSRSLSTAQSFSPAKTRTQSRAFTPPIFIPPLPRGTGGGFGKPIKTLKKGKGKKTKTIFGQFFGAGGLNIKGGADLTGLLIR